MRVNNFSGGVFAAALAISWTFVQAADGQHGACGTVLSAAEHQKLVNNARAMNAAGDGALVATNFVVPISFHVVRRSDGSGGINEGQLATAINDANIAFASAGMSFCRVGPILYVDSDYYYQQANTTADILTLFQIGRVPDTINVYLLPFLTTEQGALCGLATFTTNPIGGVAMRYSCTGTGPQGTSFPHEIGHYFDLLHTHDGVQCTSGFNCEETGDLVCDTPPDPQLGLHNIAPGCVYVGQEPDPCGTTQRYSPLVNNIMSYSPPSCRTSLTAGQLARTRQTLIVLRPELALPSCPAPTGPNADLTRLSINSHGVAGNGNSANAAVSADGRIIAFASQSTNLDGRDADSGWDVYVHDRLSGETELISVSLTGGPGNGGSDRPSVSGDGRFIVFESTATNLVSSTTIPFKQVYLRDRLEQTTSLLSAAPTGEPGNSDSDRPTISRNGLVVAFASYADNLITGDANGQQDVFVRDLSRGVTECVSVSSTGEQGNGNSPSSFSDRIDLTADGRLIVFASSATNLIANDANKSFSDVFVHDRSSGQTILVGKNTAGEQADFGSTHPDIAASGRYVAFMSSASNLAPDPNSFAADVFLHDLVTGQTTMIGMDANGQQFSQGSGYPSLSANGKRIAFQRTLSFTFPTSNDVYVRDTAAGTVLRVNPSIDGLGSSFGTKFAAISDGGNVVVYQSDAANLVLNDVNGATDVFGYALPGAPPIPGDANLDGIINIDDLVIVITGWGTCPATQGCAGDVNGSGAVNIDDLVLVILNWGQSSD